MRIFRRFRIAVVAILCLPFTGVRVGWAEPAHPGDLYIEDPYAPHKADGSIARLGTAVGYVYGQPVDVIALGVTAAVGERWDRFSLEAEYSFLGFSMRNPSPEALDNTALGNGHRLGVIARYEVVRLESNVMGPNSMLALYVEGGAATAWNHWYRPDMEENRIVPDDTKRVEGQVGFGIMLDHRLQEPIGFPRRIGWFLGWRLAMAPHEAMTGSVCRGVECRPVPMMDDPKLVDNSMLFQSSLAFTF